MVSWTSLISVLLTWCAPMLDAQEADKEPLIQCPSCDHTGHKDCKAHGRTELELMREGVLCSECAQCSRCGGTSYIDCLICSNKASEQRDKEHAERIAKWLKERRETIDKHFKRDLLQGSSDHVDLVFDLKPMKVEGGGNLKWDSHRLLHLYLQRIETVRAAFLKVLEASEREMSARTQVFMWADMNDQREAAPRFAGMGSGGTGVKLMGTHQVYTMIFDKRRLRDDLDLHRNVIHNVAHLFLANLSPEQWTGNLKGGWIDAGLAHYFEYTLDQKCTNFCYEEVATGGEGFKGGNWRPAVRKMVSSNSKYPSFAEISQKNTDQLTGEEHALAFSYVDFLITQYGGKKFKQLARGLKAWAEVRDLLNEVYGLNPLSIEEPWKQWVVETYPLRETPGK
jgi:hypothetical protein